MTIPQNVPKAALSKSSICGRLSTGALMLAGIALVGMAIVEGWQVFARYVLNDSPSWTEPVALLLMSVTMMLGAAIGVRQEAHFGFFIVAESSPAKIKAFLHVICRLIVAAIGLLMAVLGTQLMLDSWSYPMAGVSLPQGIVFLPVSVGGALIVVFALERIMVTRATRTTLSA